MLQSMGLVEQIFFPIPIMKSPREGELKQIESGRILKIH
ncbi:hypothetical protein N0824_03051 [Microcystis sp. 0824]|nr:hypothetical protein N0824_03051 [Microcystis sp. 0824]